MANLSLDDKYVAIERVDHNRVGYWPGDEVKDLSAEQAQHLLSLKVIKAVNKKSSDVEASIVDTSKVASNDPIVPLELDAGKILGEKNPKQKSNKRRVKRGKKKAVKQPSKLSAPIATVDTLKSATPKKADEQKRRGKGRPSKLRRS